jgi:AcrR family transcriptional regulator
MPRWEQGAEDRLREAALQLFLEHGYENVTVAQITERAGLTRRTFSRYFADKRDVLFAGSEQLPAALAEAVLTADAALTPFEALLGALERVGNVVADRAGPHAAQRQAIVNGSVELQERGRTKFAAVSDALEAALRQRGAAPSTAGLLADVGVAIFRTAFQRWADDPDPAAFPVRVREAANELARALDPADQFNAPAPLRSVRRPMRDPEPLMSPHDGGRQRLGHES